MRVFQGSLLHATLQFRNAYQYHNQGLNLPLLCSLRWMQANACLCHLSRMFAHQRSEGLSNPICKGYTFANFHKDVISFDTTKGEEQLGTASTTCSTTWIASTAEQSSQPSVARGPSSQYWYSPNAFLGLSQPICTSREPLFTAT
jgi:hypothetical protein